MYYKTFFPPEHLQPFVRFFWVLQSTSSNNALKTFNAVVDGCPGMIVVDTEKDAFCEVHNKKLPDVFLYGQTTQPVSFSTAGNLNILGVCLQPNALKSIFGFDASEFTRASFDINLLDLKEKDLSQRLYDATSIEEKIKLLAQYLGNSIQHNHFKQDVAVNQALSLIDQSKGNISLQELQQQLHMSVRNLERRFQQSVGISPKYFSRIRRFQETLQHMRFGDYEKLSDIAYQNDYADQSHFIRAFKEFTGLSPVEFRNQTGSFSENFPQMSA